MNQKNLQPFNQCYIKMEIIFINNENSKTNELTNLDYLYQINLILKTQTKILH